MVVPMFEYLIAFSNRFDNAWATRFLTRSSDLSPKTLSNVGMRTSIFFAGFGCLGVEIRGLIDREPQWAHSLRLIAKLP